ncbi:MAG TPA: c-type cytochrome domain-containing protein [Terracidiphilus sp.]
MHLPIGLLVLLPLLEIGGAFRPALREAANFVLWLAFAACLLAITLGFLLAYGGGEAGVLVTRHMAGGITLTIVVLLSILARPWSSSGRLDYVYPGLVTCMLLALIWTADQGGSLTHGSNYLTQYMPGGLKRIALIGRQATSTNSFYAQQVYPILDANCVSCHGASKTSGGLRMDSYDALMKGGKDGPVVVAGQADKSLLLRRVTLPPGHKEFMPAEGKPPLRGQEISYLRAWIQQGASPTAATLSGIATREREPDPAFEPVGDYSALNAEIHETEQAQGAKLIPVSAKPADGLTLSTIDRASNFGDRELAEFQKFAPYIVEAELARTAVTDASFDTLKQFTHLRALHLEGTHVTGNGLAKLAPLSQLTYLNLSGTEVTQAATTPLGAMKNLRHIYLYNTPAQPVPIAEPAGPTGGTTP